MRIMALLCWVFVASCGNSKVKTKIEAVSFNSKVGFDEVLAFNFDKDVVDSTLLNIADTSSLMNINPKIQGQYIWSTTRQLLFKPSTAYSFDTVYTIAVGNEIFGQMPFELEGNTSFSFNTPASLIKSIVATYEKGNMSKQGVVYVDLVFEYDMLPLSLLNGVELYLNDKKISFNITTRSVAKSVTLKGNINDVNDSGILGKLILKKGLSTYDGFIVLNSDLSSNQFFIGTEGATNQRQELEKYIKPAVEGDTSMQSVLPDEASPEEIAALSAIDALLRKQPTAELYLQKANTLVKVGNLKLALTCFNQALLLDPKNEVILNNRGVCYNGLKDYTKAIADFNQVLKLNPKSQDALLNRGFAFSCLVEHKKAIADFMLASQINSLNPYAYNNMAYSYLKLGKIDSAQIFLAKSEKLNPKNSWVYRNWACYYAVKKDYVKTNNYFDRALVLGYKDYDWIMTEPLLAAYRKTPEYKKLKAVLK